MSKMAEYGKTKIHGGTKIKSTCMKIIWHARVQKWAVYVKQKHYWHANSWNQDKNTINGNTNLYKYTPLYPLVAGVGVDVVWGGGNTFGN